MLIARLIADPAALESGLEAMMAVLSDSDTPIAHAAMLDFCGDVLQIESPGDDLDALRRAIRAAFDPSDCLIARDAIRVPDLFVSDMDSTMIGQECIDELADFAGLKAKVAEITERAMQGELDFESALRERVGLLEGLDESAIHRCLDERIRPNVGARVLVETLKSKGCRTVLVTGGFHHFADVVAEQIGFERVVGNRLKVQEGKLTGKLVGAITDSATKKRVLEEEVARLGERAISMAAGDGANDIPMLEASDYGVAYFAKPKAREAANGWVERGDLTVLLKLLEVPEADWVG
ncbi:phosphoserine phosphatase SerB [Aurantiacibacter gangjinensis]|uniref:Phosphoserine phosphatase n=1 Tax=Aurantiacibacter gangjinensis TaxID=502682 RepID=A0A0G9MSR4_9SPHN|nr:phosphoserine phosphatase SerB [Aurantiacibacter gangjinensis]APE28633.1 Phosphoserine phosphatase [Aurantiacibacter gangjinensis]KLE33609.1 phosphoserine phosphatase [Aurantiacibacter gangjinensis]